MIETGFMSNRDPWNNLDRQTSKSSQGSIGGKGNSSAAWNRNPERPRTPKQRIPPALLILGLAVLVGGIALIIFLDPLPPPPEVTRTPLPDIWQFAEYYPDHTQFFLTLDYRLVPFVDQLLVDIGMFSHRPITDLLSTSLAALDQLGPPLSDGWGEKISIGSVMNDDEEGWILVVELTNSIDVLAFLQQLVTNNLVQTVPSVANNESRFLIGDQVIAIRDNVLLLHDSNLQIDDKLSSDSTFDELARQIDGGYSFVAYTNYSESKPAELILNSLPITLQSTQSAVGAQISDQSIDVRWISPAAPNNNADSTSQLIDPRFTRYIPDHTLFFLQSNNLQSYYNSLFEPNGSANPELNSIVTTMSTVLSIGLGIDYKRELDWMQGDFLMFLAAFPDSQQADWGMVIESNDGNAPRNIVTQLTSSLTFRSTLMQLLQIDFLEIQPEMIESSYAIGIDTNHDQIPADFVVGAHRDAMSDVLLIGSRQSVRNAIVSGKESASGEGISSTSQFRLQVNTRSIQLFTDLLEQNKILVPLWLQNLENTLGNQGSLQIDVNRRDKYQDVTVSINY
jgi:hypothetical protein